MNEQDHVTAATDPAKSRLDPFEAQLIEMRLQFPAVMPAEDVSTRLLEVEMAQRQLRIYDDQTQIDFIKQVLRNRRRASND